MASSSHDWKPVVRLPLYHGTSTSIRQLRALGIVGGMGRSRDPHVYVTTSPAYARIWAINNAFRSEKKRAIVVQIKREGLKGFRRDPYFNADTEDMDVNLKHPISFQIGYIPGSHVAKVIWKDRRKR